MPILSHNLSYDEFQLTKSGLCRVVRTNDGLDVPADVEIAHYFHLPWRAGLNKVRQDFVYRGFVKDTHGPVGVDVKLEGFEFDALGPRLVTNTNGSKVRKPAPRAKGRPLRTYKFNIIAASLVRVFKGFQ